MKLPDDIISNRVAQNARYNQHKKDRPESTHRLNVADDILSVLNMFQNSRFIREVIMTCSSKPPSIILYTDLQSYNRFASYKKNCRLIWSICDKQLQ
jgi:hypothetical protein